MNNEKSFKNIVKFNEFHAASNTAPNCYLFYLVRYTVDTRHPMKCAILCPAYALYPRQRVCCVHAKFIQLHSYASYGRPLQSRMS